LVATADEDKAPKNNLKQQAKEQQQKQKAE
jgi:hypothetical protein